MTWRRSRRWPPRRSPGNTSVAKGNPGRLPAICAGRGGACVEIAWAAEKPLAVRGGRRYFSGRDAAPHGEGRSARRHRTCREPLQGHKQRRDASFVRSGHQWARRFEGAACVA
jgi:hypothetical protein